MKLSQSEIEFYQNLYPCLRDDRWTYTGAEAWGYVWWRQDLDEKVVFDELEADVEIGILKKQSTANFFVVINNDKYPSFSYEKDILLDIEKVCNEELVTEALKIGTALLEIKSSVIRCDRVQKSENLAAAMRFDQERKSDKGSA